MFTYHPVDVISHLVVFVVVVDVVFVVVVAVVTVIVIFVVSVIIIQHKLLIIIFDYFYSESKWLSHIAGEECNEIIFKFSFLLSESRLIVIFFFSGFNVVGED